MQNISNNWHLEAAPVTLWFGIKCAYVIFSLKNIQAEWPTE